MTKIRATNIEAGAIDTAGLEDDIALLGFKVASNGSLGKYNLVDQTEDSFVDATGIDASASTQATRDAGENSIRVLVTLGNITVSLGFVGRRLHPFGWRRRRGWLSRRKCRFY